MSQPTLARRVALPLGLSLLAHAALLGGLALVRHAAPAAPAGAGGDAPRFSLCLVALEQPAPELKADPEGEWQPVLVQAPRETPADAGPEPADAGPEPAGVVQASTPAVAGGGGATPAAVAGKGLLAAPPTARRVVYLLDCSVSMGPSGALAAGRREVADSLRRLPPDALFQVIAYNQLAEPFALRGRRTELAPAPAAVGEAVRLLGEVRATGRTDHAAALRCALRLRPDVLFLVTDAGDLDPGLRGPLVRLFHSGPPLHVVELCRPRPDRPALLADLTRLTGGSYRRVGLGP
jgi:hypothetical protein